MDRGRAWVLACIVVLSALRAAAAADHAFARSRTISPPDCASVDRLVVEFDSAPTDVTYMRVQHIGDPGSAELAGEVAHPVTWDASAFTGFGAPPAAQRGFADAYAHSVFQVACGDAGFFMNSATFSHVQPLVGEGPNVSIARDFGVPQRVFANGQSTLLEADVKLPWAQAMGDSVVEGTAQVGFFVYLRDTTTNRVITQVVGLFDNRPAGVGGSGTEFLGHDGVNAFVSSPLATVDGSGQPVRFVASLASSAQMQYVSGWSAPRHFAALVSPAHFAAALAALRAQGLAISGRPADYVVQSFGINGEIIPGVTREHEVALGASVSGLALRVVPLAPSRSTFGAL
jgi:hypothetical protein